MPTITCLKKYKNSAKFLEVLHDFFFSSLNYLYYCLNLEFKKYSYDFYQLWWYFLIVTYSIINNY